MNLVTLLSSWLPEEPELGALQAGSECPRWWAAEELWSTVRITRAYSAGTAVVEGGAEGQ